MENYIPFFHWLRSTTYHVFIPQTHLGFFVKNQLGDLLWAYALEITLVLSTGNFKKSIIWGIAIAVASECCQLFSFIYATFDILDILAQVAGVILAHIIIRTFYSHWLTIE